MRLIVLLIATFYSSQKLVATANRVMNANHSELIFLLIHENKSPLNNYEVSLTQKKITTHIIIT